MEAAVNIRHFVIIPGQPVAKGRPRFANGHAYSPKLSQRWEQSAAFQIQSIIGSPRYACPMKLEVTAYFHRPLKMNAKKYSTNRIHHTSRPDADNVLKAVCDALTLAGVVKDDSVLNHVVLTKYYAAKNAPAQVVILLDSWEDEHHATDRITKQPALERHKQ